jgi:metal-responsive CopG/Arc/MetJ family transcriptional regulator
MRKKKFTENVGVLFTTEIYQQLVKITNDREISSSEFIRDLVEREIKKTKKENKCHANSN